MTTDACTPSEADLRAEIAKLELELKGVTEKARLTRGPGQRPLTRAHRAEEEAAAARRQEEA
tara:strand:+ start:345 stop:530 length:186 start_codon:yes stop_codon:yes gene_type:complete